MRRNERAGILCVKVLCGAVVGGNGKGRKEELNFLKGL